MHGGNKFKNGSDCPESDIQKKSIDLPRIIYINN